YFDYGTSTNFTGSTAPAIVGSGFGIATNSSLLTNLSPGATYYYRVIVSNSFGNAIGSNVSFVMPLLPSINSIATTTNGSFLLQFNGAAGLSYTLLRSTNLVDWLPMTNLPAGSNGLFNFTDGTATNSARFYRLRNP